MLYLLTSLPTPGQPKRSKGGGDSHILRVNVQSKKCSPLSLKIIYSSPSAQHSGGWGCKSFIGPQVISKNWAPRGFPSKNIDILN